MLLSVEPLLFVKEFESQDRERETEMHRRKEGREGERERGREGEARLALTILPMVMFGGRTSLTIF